jgi:hypothetical protein
MSEIRGEAATYPCVLQVPLAPPVPSNVKHAQRI